MNDNIPGIREIGTIRLRDIPVCRYSLNAEHEKHIYSKRDFVRIYRDMNILREFSVMLSELSEKGESFDIRFSLPFSYEKESAEEAVAVGLAYCMEKGDLLFPTEKGILHTLARGLRAIEKLTDRELATVMKGHLNGETLSPVAERANSDTTIKDLSVDFLLYGLISELFGKKTGFSRGLAGASRVSFMPFYSFPAMSPMAPIGAALHMRAHDDPHFCAVSLDRKALRDGSAWEAMDIAADRGFAAEYRRTLPLLFTVITPVEAEGEYPEAEPEAARMGAGLAVGALHTERVDGVNPMAVIDAVARKKEILERGEGPALIEFVTYKRSERPARKANDPLVAYREKLLQSRIATEAELHEIDAETKRRLSAMLALAADDSVSPRASLSTAEPAPAKEESHRTPALYPETKTEKPCSRMALIASKSRFGYSEDGEPLPKAKRYNLADAIFEPLYTRFAEDPRFLMLASVEEKEGVLEGLSETISANRLVFTEISDPARLQIAMGYALMGGSVALSLTSGNAIPPRALHELSLFGKLQGDAALPILIRIPCKNGESECYSAMCALPHVKVLYPVTPADMHGMLNAALEKKTPAILFEDRRLYELGECFREGGVPEGKEKTSLGTAEVKRAGRDLTILTVGATLYKALEAAEILSVTYKLEAEVVDARSLVPFDYETLIHSVSKTGKLIVAGDASERASILRDIASNVAEFAFDLLDAPPVTVGAREALSVSATTILDAIHQKILPLADYSPLVRFDSAEKIRLAKLGL